MARVIVITPDKTQTNHRLVKRITTIGRTPANQIQIHDGAASRKHCLIKLIGESFSLVDLGSANGTVHPPAPYPHRVARLSHEEYHGSLKPNLSPSC